MGHVLLAAPGIRRYHLHERLARELRTRGHRVTALCTDPVEFGFWTAQGMPALLARPCRGEVPGIPARELAEVECRLAGLRPSRALLGRTARWIHGIAAHCLRWFEHDPPDLLFLHGRRPGGQGALRFLARQLGIGVLWTGSGLLPHTIQVDGEGIDGDSSATRKTAFDYRSVAPNRVLLDAALTAVLARNEPFPLSRRPVHVPPLPERLRQAVAHALRPGGRGFLGALHAFREALPRESEYAAGRAELPAQPFVAVLLQGDDARTRLDSSVQAPPSRIVEAAAAAARSIDERMLVVAVLPREGIALRERNRIATMAGVRIERAAAAPDAAAAAAAAVTINHPLGALSMLAGTPVLHLGRALYGIGCMALRSSIETLASDLRLAFAEQERDLCERFLTWLLTEGHVWCSPDVPDHNGLMGLVLEVEERLGAGHPEAVLLHYRPGPSWPLAAEGA
ncbi:MAG: hypothetical protein Fur0037_21240 [Planctomycetota bacterium]